MQGIKPVIDPIKKQVMRKYSFLLLVFVGVMMFSCQKQENEPYQKLVFKSLTASSTSFNSGSSVNVVADAEGTNLTYYWSYNTGTVEGSGGAVVYTCDEPGVHKLICTVKDGGGEIDAKEINFYVQ
jgi:hypothetical protein